MPSMRLHVPIRDVPPASAARALGLTLDAFSEALPKLIERGFPWHDPTTGNNDLKAIDQWQNLRHPQLFAGEKSATSLDASVGIRERLRAAHR